MNNEPNQPQDFAWANNFIGKINDQLDILKILFEDIQSGYSIVRAIFEQSYYTVKIFDYVNQKTFEAELLFREKLLKGPDYNHIVQIIAYRKVDTI